MTTNKRLSVTILSLFILTIMTGATVIPILGNIRNTFDGVNNIYYKLILTITSVMVIPATFISSRLTTILRKKSVLIVGLLLYMIGGVGGGFSSSIYVLLIFRCVLGMGLGLIIPISTSSIADFYEGNQRLKMMGYSSGVRSLGGIIAPLLAGFLATYNWRYAFGIYSVAFVLLILVILFFKEKKSQVVYEKKNLPVDVYKLAFGMFIMYVISFAFTTNLSLFLFTYNIGDSQLSSILIFLLNCSIFLSGLTLSFISKVLKKYIMVVAYILMGVSFIIFSYSLNTIYMGIATVLIGLSVGILSPTYMVRTTKIVSANQRSFAIAIVSSCMFLGQFVSPLISLLIQSVFNYGDIKLPFYISIVLCCIIVLFYLSSMSLKRKDANVF